MKILVTGGAGFIGSHVVNMFIKNGYDVVIVDNLANGKKENINPKAKFCKLDIRSKRLKDVFIKENPTYLIHLAAQVSVNKSMEDPSRDAEINIIGSIKLLELCRKYNIEKIIYSGSCARYGKPKRLPCKESDPTKPLSFYGISKYTVEKYLYIYNKIYSLDYNTLILGNVYGPKQDSKGEAGVVSIFTNNLIKGKECTIYGDGNQTRNFIYVKDVAKAFLSATKTKTKIKSFNIATGKPTTVNRVFSMLKKLNGGGEHKHAPERKGEIKHIYLDISKAKKHLKWSPETNLEKGLKLTYEYFKGVNA